MRIGYAEDEEFAGQFELWQANCRRSLAGKKGQAALHELEAALVALPEKRLIAGKLIDTEGGVCSIGALAKYKGREMVANAVMEDDWEDESVEKFGVELGMPRLVAWKVVWLNDIEIDGHIQDAAGPPSPRYPGHFPRVLVPVTPEERYEEVLAWVRAHIKQEQP